MVVTQLALLNLHKITKLCSPTIQVSHSTVMTDIHASITVTLYIDAHVCVGV